MAHKFLYYWSKIDRFFAWILFLAMISYFISGYGMTKGIIDYSLALKIHNEILPLVIIISFIIHGSYATRLALIRWKVWNVLTKIIWVIIFLGFLSGLIYLEVGYEKAQPETNNTTDSTNTETSAVTGGTANDTSSTQSSEKTFTLEELKQYDGKNGNAAYVAVDGDVYDLSTIFKSGAHFEHFAGQELTNAFYTRHAKIALSKYPVIGKLIK